MKLPARKSAYGEYTGWWPWRQHGRRMSLEGGGCHKAIVVVVVTRQLWWWLSKGNCGGGCHKAIVVVVVTRQLWWWLSQGNCGGGSHKAIVVVVVTRQLWWKLSQGNCGGGCHRDDTAGVNTASHWTSAVQGSLWLPQYPELTQVQQSCIALASPGLSQMVLFLHLLYSFVKIAANSVLKSTRIFHNDISHLCNEISWQYRVWYEYYDKIYIIRNYHSMFSFG